MHEIFEKMKNAMDPVRDYRESQGISSSEVAKTAVLNGELIAKYLRSDWDAMFTIESLFESDRKREITNEFLTRLIETLRARMNTGEALRGADAYIAFEGAYRGISDPNLVKVVAENFSKHNESNLLSCAQLLIPIVGPNYLYRFQNSMVTEEIGMCGPHHYVFRDWALEILCRYFKVDLPQKTDFAEGMPSEMPWSTLLKVAPRPKDLSFQDWQHPPVSIFASFWSHIVKIFKSNRI